MGWLLPRDSLRLPVEDVRIVGFGGVGERAGSWCPGRLRWWGRWGQAGPELDGTPLVVLSPNLNPLQRSACRKASAR